MVAPQTWASLKRTLGVNKETAPGAGGTPTQFIPFTKFDWNDKPAWLKDMGVRGVMGNDAFGVVQGVLIGELDFEGPCYGDTAGFLIGNILGDVTATGTAIAPTGTLSALSLVGATSVPSSVSIPSGTLIQIDVAAGSLAEVVTTTGPPTGAGPFTIPVPALAKPHASGVAITAIQATGPFSHAFSLLNSGQGAGGATGSAQPTTHALTQFYGPTASTGTRQFVSVVFTEVTFKWVAESEFMTYSAKAVAFASASAPQPTAVYTGALPIAAWKGVLGLAGPASGGTQVLTAESGEFSLKRGFKAYFTAQNSQSPYIIQRGGLTADWKNSFVAADETPLTYLKSNTQPQHQFILSNGGAGAALLSFQFDMQNAAFTEAKANNGKEAIGWDAVGMGVFNATNAGYSGGLSPAKVTLTNAIIPGSYL